MSPKAVLIAVGLALALVGLTIMLTGQRGATPAPASATPGAGGGAGSAAGPSFAPAEVSALSLARGDGAEQRVRRSEAGAWFYQAGRVEWPVLIPDAAQAALAALAGELKPQEGAKAPEAGGPLLTITLRDGAAYALRLAPSALAGKTSAALTYPGGTANVLVSSATLDPLVNPGPASWRTPSALPGVRDASRLTLDDARVNVALAKLEGKWSMRRPISSGASQNAVDSLLNSLAGIRALRFEDQPKPDLAAMGLNKPVLTVSVETDERTVAADGQVRVRTVTRELIVGGPADPKGDTRFASADADGSVIMVVPASAVNAITLAPRNLLQPSPVSVSPSDVFMVTIRESSAAGAGSGPSGAPAWEKGFRREGAGWVAMQPDGKRAPAEAAPLDELLEFLASRPGEPEPIGPDDSIRVLRKLDLFDSDGDAREVLSVGYTADGSFAVRSGNLLVAYRGVTPPSVLNLPAFETLPPEAPPAPPPSAIPGSPVIK
ncbi:MAG: DUF4340 domain-containing protein [Planctomycetota bacterium]|nr:DUF4340 domain-containing protein [Planctomycetota bacterium]